MKNKTSISIVIFILCLLMNACNDKSTVKSDKNEAADDSMQITDKLEYPVQIPIGTKCIVDLDKDGKKESVSYMANKASNGEEDVTSFKINDTEYKDRLYGQLGFWMDNPNLERYYIADIDVADNLKEIAILDEGPSGDPQTYFLQYNGNEIKYIGSIAGFPSDAECKFDGKGTVISKGRLSILQTWWAPMKWALDKDGNLKYVHEDMYYPYDGDDSGSRQALLKDLYVYKKPDLKAEQIKVGAGNKVTFTSTDNEHWVCLKSEDGTEGWFYMESVQYILQKGKQVESTSIFGNLNFAD